jgi:transposase
MLEGNEGSRDDTHAGDPAHKQDATPVSLGEPRLLKPQRLGVVRVPCSLDEMLPQDHMARAIWGVIETLDVSEFEATIRSRGSQAGRPAIDPRILITLWVYAGCEGVSEARAVDRLCKMHAAYQWICGGVSVDYHVLSDFRVEHGEALDRMMSQVLGRLKERGQVPLERTSQDGMRVRASAGAASFHREGTLQEHLQEAQEQLQQISEPTLPQA